MRDRPVVSRWRAALPSLATGIAALTAVAFLVSRLAAQEAGGLDPAAAGDPTSGAAGTLWNFL
ncbi:MAG: hypothetical protein WDA75_24775, partial [Candidatus Latescibacterota bacterium]